MVNFKKQRFQCFLVRLVTTKGCCEETQAIHSLAPKSKQLPNWKKSY